ncbi:MAG: NosD domain-containing protein [Nanoarchaeota archaeon]
MKKQIMLMLTIFISLFALSIPFSAAADCGGDVQCQCGDSLVESQDMWYDMRCAETALFITEPDLSLNCRNHRIFYLNDSMDHGIEVHSDNTAITDCDIRDFYVGIILFSADNEVSSSSFSNGNKGIYVDPDSSGNTIQGNFFLNPVHAGIFLDQTDSNSVIGNTLMFTLSSQSDYGIKVERSPNNAILSNEVRGFEYGLKVFRSDGNRFESNNVWGNDLGIELRGAHHNSFKNNIITMNFIGVSIPAYNLQTTENNFSRNVFLANSYLGMEIFSRDGKGIVAQDNIIWDNDFMLTGIVDNDELLNIYCVNGIGNRYHAGATGPGCAPPMPDPDGSFITLTDHGHPGLLTCPMDDTDGYQHVKVTVIDQYDSPMPGIDAGLFDLGVITANNSQWYPGMEFYFIPKENATNESGELEFTLQANSSFRGSLQVIAIVDGVQLPLSEFLHAASVDLKIDGQVDVFDLQKFATWFNTSSNLTDFNFDGWTDYDDFEIFKLHWEHTTDGPMEPISKLDSSLFKPTDEFKVVGPVVQPLIRPRPTPVRMYN